MSKSWAEKNNAAKPTPASAAIPSYAALNENGTGPFIVESHQPGVKTVWKANRNWWDAPKHNLDEVILTPISSDPTRVAALLSGEVDWISPVPQQDIERIDASGKAQVLQGPDLRTVFFGFDQTRDELKYSNVKGKNPFKDPRVKKAFYQAVDIEGIKAKIMRGAATPTPLLISPLLFEGSGEFKRFPYDPDASRKLLAEAGYPNGFEITLDCPNDRYLNDERICQATVGMLARIGVKVTLNAQPKAKYFAKILSSGGYDTSFYLLGWSPAVMDSIDIFNNILGCRDEKGNGGTSNIGNYCSQKVQDLAKQILIETDKAKRDALIKDAWKTAMIDDVAVLPLHQQALAWGVSKKVDTVENRIRFATYGYSGFFDVVQIKEDQLDRIYRFDLALFSYAEKRSAALIKDAGVPYRLGPLRRSFFYKFNLWYYIPRQKTGQAEYQLNLKILRSLRLSNQYRFPRVEIPELSTKPLKGRYIVMHAYKRSGTALVWPLENFQALARHYAAQKTQVIVVGDRDGHEILHSYFGAIPLTEIHTELNLVQTAALMRGARHVFGNSSGPLHLAALVGAPHTGFYPQNKIAAPRRWRTLPAPATPRLSEHLLSTDFPVNCLRCKLESCTYYPCTKSISVESAVASTRFWKRAAPSHVKPRKKTAKKRQRR